MASPPQAVSNRDLETPDIAPTTGPDTDGPSEYKKNDGTPRDDEETASKRIEVPLDAFGDESNAEIQYKTMKWWQASMVMVAENISLGVLSLPAVIGTVGLAAGITTIIVLGIFASYSGYVLWQFRMRYPQVASYTDVGKVLAGRVGYEIFSAAYVIYCLFFMASHLLTFTIALNVLSRHGTCTIVFGIVGLVVFSILTIPRTLKNVSFLSIVSFISILSAVLITIIALGVSPQAAYEDMQAVYHPNFPTAFNSICNAVFAYAGHVAWVSFISELRDPKDFPKALGSQQLVQILLYTMTAIVIYRYAGADVASPALSSTGAVVRKVAWGVAIPTIIIAGVIFAHVNAKYIYLRMFAGTRYLHSRGLVATGSWIALGVGTWTIAWIIAESIPNFSDLLGFVSALFGAWFSFGIPGFLWLYMNQGLWFLNWRKMCLFLTNVVLILLGFIICGVGLYSSGWSMAQNSTGRAWSCADNSG
ncbi:putative Amino acid transporter transmembrane domain-containing protein [Seiridium cardinale]|uniref:Amino acid transporter transmembrane domain-containing protein n=1 Tax=Seiridium cardinale TaxID=138064 RepID=A0ABR2Y165_9PEZI